MSVFLFIVDIDDGVVPNVAGGTLTMTGMFPYSESTTPIINNIVVGIASAACASRSAGRVREGDIVFIFVVTKICSMLDYKNRLPAELIAVKRPHVGPYMIETAPREGARARTKPLRSYDDVVIDSNGDVFEKSTNKPVCLRYGAENPRGDFFIDIIPETDEVDEDGDEVHSKHDNIVIHWNHRCAGIFGVKRDLCRLVKQCINSIIVCSTRFVYVGDREDRSDLQFDPENGIGLYIQTLLRRHKQTYGIKVEEFDFIVEVMSKWGQIGSGVQGEPSSVRLVGADPMPPRIASLQEITKGAK